MIYIVAYSAIAALCFIVCMVISFKFNEETCITAKIAASLFLSITWPMAFLVVALLDIKCFLVQLWRKIKK